MKTNVKYILSIIFFFVLNINTVLPQIDVGARLTSRSIQTKAPYNNYESGFQAGIYFFLFDKFKCMEDLTWEAAIGLSFMQNGFYPPKSGGFIVTNGNIPLNTSEKFLHRIWTLDFPVRLRYNAFSFMGILGGIEFSYLLEGNTYIPRLARTNHGFHYRKITPLIEGGLFFALGKRFILETTVFKSTEDRFSRVFRKIRMARKYM